MGRTLLSVDFDYSPDIPGGRFYNGFAFRNFCQLAKIGVTSILNEVRVRAGAI